MPKNRTENGETAREERIRTAKASQTGIPNSKGEVPEQAVLNQTMEITDDGKLKITTESSRDGVVQTDSVEKVKAKALDKQKRAAENENKSKEEPAVIQELMKDGKSDMDSIVSNIKNSDIMKAIGDQSSALKKRIEQINNRKPDDTIPDEDEKVQEELDKPGESYPKPDLEQYLESVLALPTNDDGLKQSEKMKQYLTKIASKSTNSLTQEDIDKAVDVLKREPIDYKGIAMKCPEKASQCPHQECPFKKIYKLPIGEQCPVELTYIDSIIQRYMIDLAYDEDELLSLAEMNLIVSLADVDITDIRLRGMITQLGYLMDDISVDPRSGKDILNKKMNPIIEMMKTNDKRKSTVLRQLLATPEMKERLKVKRKAAKDGAIKDVTLKEKKVESLIEKVKLHNKKKLKGEINK
jgi:hypothetical protein